MHLDNSSKAESERNQVNAWEQDHKTKATILLVARLATSNDEVQAQVNLDDFQIYSATNLDEVKSAFGKSKIDHVVMGAGIELEDRLAIIRQIFTTSDGTTVHMKDRSSGRLGYLPFVSSSVAGIREYAKSQNTNSV